MFNRLGYASTLHCVLLFAGAVTSAFLTRSAHAQDAVVTQPTAGILMGKVTDTLGIPIPDADVTISPLRRQVRTRGDGSFQFDSLPPGKYSVAARRLGYVAQAYPATVGENGGTVHIRMVPLGYRMSAVKTTADIGGLSGVIADTAYQALRNVQVSVLGTGKSAQTDTAGTFFLPLRPGQYMLRIERDGYHRQMTSVMIPENEGRKIAAWLVPLSGPPNNIQAASLFDLNQRIMRSGPASSRYYTYEELTRQGLQDLRALIGQWASGPITSECDVSIGGTPNVKIPLSLLTVAEVEFVELYLPSNIAGGGANRGTTSISGSQTKFRTPTGSTQIGAPPGCGRVGLIVWLKQ